MHDKSKTKIVSSRFFLVIFLYLTSYCHNVSSSTSFKDKITKIIAIIFNKQENYRTIKYNLTDLSSTIPYGIYLIIKELKKEYCKEDMELLSNRLILYGPPGNGKSTYARKIAEEVNAVLFEISGPSIVERYQGSGPDNINKIFAEAIEDQKKGEKKVIIFIDEIDAIASSLFDEKERADNKAATQALWINLDRIKKNPNLFVIIATNNFEKLHPALIDRFSNNKISIPNPDAETRKEIIEFYIQKFNLDKFNNKLFINDFSTLFFWIKNFISKKLTDTELNIFKRNVENLVKKTDKFSIRAIENSLKSIKRISRIENNDEPTYQMIEEILNLQKQKPLNNNISDEKWNYWYIKLIYVINAIALAKEIVSLGKGIFEIITNQEFNLVSAM